VLAGQSWRVDESYMKIRGKWAHLYRAVDRSGKTGDFRLSTRRNVAAAKAFFARAIESQGARSTTITLDDMTLRSSKNQNNMYEMRPEVAYRSCSPFSPHGRSEPPVWPGKSRSLNQERL